MTSFLARVQQSRANTVCYVVAPVEGDRTAWYFIRVEPAKLNAFQRDIMAGPVYFPDYGEILAKGFGNYAPEDVIQRMRDEEGYQG
jgi:hypothetical protein